MPSGQPHNEEEHFVAYYIVLNVFDFFSETAKIINDFIILSA